MRTHVHTRADTYTCSVQEGLSVPLQCCTSQARTDTPTHIHTNIHIHMQLPGGALRALAVLRQPSINTPTHIRTHTPSHAASRRGSPCPCSAAQAKLPARARVPFCSCSDGRCTGRNCGRPGGSEPTLGAKVCAFSVCCACVCVCV